GCRACHRLSYSLPPIIDKVKTPLRRQKICAYVEITISVMAKTIRWRKAHIDVKLEWGTRSGLQNADFSPVHINESHDTSQGFDGNRDFFSSSGRFAKFAAILRA
ncbi:MAG: hypothetical protein WA728_32420, partial [Xanthobacteraceae bacterium]